MKRYAEMRDIKNVDSLLARRIHNYVHKGMVNVPYSLESSSKVAIKRGEYVLETKETNVVDLVALEYELVKLKDKILRRSKGQKTQVETIDYMLNWLKSPDVKNLMRDKLLHYRKEKEYDVTAYRLRLYKDIDTRERNAATGEFNKMFNIDMKRWRTHQVVPFYDYHETVDVVYTGEGFVESKDIDPGRDVELLLYFKVKPVSEEEQQRREEEKLKEALNNPEKYYIKTFAGKHIYLIPDENNDLRKELAKESDNIIIGYLGSTELHRASVIVYDLAFGSKLNTFSMSVAEVLTQFQIYEKSKRTVDGVMYTINTTFETIEEMSRFVSYYLQFIRTPEEMGMASKEELADAVQ